MQKSSTWQNSSSKLSIGALLETFLLVAQVYSSEPLLTSRKSELTFYSLTSDAGRSSLDLSDDQRERTGCIHSQGKADSHAENAEKHGMFL